MADKAELLALGDGRFRIEGALDFDTVTGLLGASESKFAGVDVLNCDLSGVTRANSAGMALMLEWRARCESRGQTLVFSDVPESVLQLARVCEVEDVLSGDPALG